MKKGFLILSLIVSFLTVMIFFSGIALAEPKQLFTQKTQKSKKITPFTIQKSFDLSIDKVFLEDCNIHIVIKNIGPVKVSDTGYRSGLLVIRSRPYNMSWPLSKIDLRKELNSPRRQVEFNTKLKLTQKATIEFLIKKVKGDLGKGRKRVKQVLIPPALCAKVKPVAKPKVAPSAKPPAQKSFVKGEEVKPAFIKPPELKVQPTVRWSAPGIRVSKPARKHKPPPLGQPVSIKKPTKKFQFSEKVKKNIKIVKRKPIPFEPFEILDPKTGKPISPNTILYMPKGLSKRGKRKVAITAQQYYSELNKLERDFNALGYSLDFRRDPTPRVKLQQIVIDPATAARMEQQRRLLKDAHKFPWMAPPKTIDIIQTEFRQNLEQNRINLKQLQEFRQRLITPGQQFGPQQQTPPFSLVPFAYASPGDLVKPYHKLIQTPEFELGWRDVFAVFFNGTAELSGNDNKIEINSTAEAGGYLFNNKVSILRITGDLSAPFSDGQMKADLTMYIADIACHRVNQTATVPVNVDQLPQIPYLDPTDVVEESYDESFETSFPLGPILLSIKVGARASTGIDYGLFLNPVNVNGQFGTFVAADVYAQAGINIIIAKAGVSVSLLLLDNSLTLSSGLQVKFDGQRPYFLALFSIYDKIEALSGEMELYACILVPMFDIPPWGYKCWDWEIWKFKGFDDKGYIVKETTKKSYFYEEGPAEEVVTEPEEGEEEFGSEEAGLGRWMPRDREVTVQGAQSRFGPSSVVFNNRLYLFWKEGSSIKYTVYADTQFRNDAHYLTYYKIYTINGSPTGIPPAVVVFKDRLYVFHGDYSGTNKIWYRYMDRNGNWWPRNFSAEVDYTSTDKRPAVAVFRDRLYYFYKKSGKKEIYYNWIHKDWVKPAADGSDLFDLEGRRYREMAIPGSHTSAGPAVAVWEDRLWVFYKGKTNKNIYYQFMGIHVGEQYGHWMPPDGRKVSGSKTTHTPVLAVFKDRLHLVHKGPTNEWIYHRIASPHEGRLDPLDWSGSENTRDTTDDTPSLSVFNNKLIKFYKWPDGVKGMATRWYEEQ